MNNPQKTIYIVEDNELYAKSLKGFLSTCFPDIRVVLFPDGETFLMERLEHPAIIILDYLLNTKHEDAANGLSIIKKIRSVNEETNIILMSAEIEFNVPATSISNEGCTYLQKDKHAFRKIETLVNEFFSKQTLSEQYH